MLYLKEGQGGDVFWESELTQFESAEHVWPFSLIVCERGREEQRRPQPCLAALHIAQSAGGYVHKS